ncbi:hypothetical protein LOD99_14312 [Oopsacas minuta]|uniref:HMG domain-containing protein n=1 Tax=Oopsacas minuta TaxID=111878 RepID=A0AAV7KFX3_9METZ|nr:hypothetical protein LOD99_14312 [Oopsacas minuta]
MAACEHICNSGSKYYQVHASTVTEDCFTGNIRDNQVGLHLGVRDSIRITPVPERTNENSGDNFILEMAEKVTSQTGSDNIYPKKRKISEKEDISFITLDIDKVCLSEGESFKLIESDVPTWSKPDQCQPDCFSEPEMKQVEMPIIDQYVKLLILKSHIHKLEDSEYVIIADYDYSQGTVVLNKRRIIIETNSNLCANCYSDTCSHYQAFELCSQNDCLQVCEANILEDIIYYFPSPNDIFLLTDDTFHNFQLNNDRWLCCSCSSKCKQHSRLHNILENTGSNTQKKFEYNTISTRAIPFNLDESQIAIYNYQLFHGINLPLNMYPEKEFCDYGFKFNEEEKLKLEKVGIVIYLENDINEFKDYKVYSSRCSGLCNCLAVFEGQNSLLLNINNKYFVHYSLLYDYSELMTMSRNTLYGYLSAKNRKLIRMGRTNTFHYHIVYQAWNAYLRTVDIDYDSNYICPKCKNHPDVIILDGIAMGTMKSVPEVDAKFDQDQQYPMIPFSDRVFIPDTAIRKQLLKFCSEGLTENTLKDLLKSIHKEMADYILFSSIRTENLVTISEEYIHVKKVIKLLCHTDPISGVFQFSLLDRMNEKQ